MLDALGQLSWESLQRRTKQLLIRKVNSSHHFLNNEQSYIEEYLKKYLLNKIVLLRDHKRCSLFCSGGVPLSWPGGLYPYPGRGYPCHAVPPGRFWDKTWDRTSEKTRRTPPCVQTHAYENISFPILRMWAVPMFVLFYSV